MQVENSPGYTVKLFADEEAIETSFSDAVAFATDIPVKLFADEEAIETLPVQPPPARPSPCETVR